MEYNDIKVILRIAIIGFIIILYLLIKESSDKKNSKTNNDKKLQSHNKFIYGDITRKPDPESYNLSENQIKKIEKKLDSIENGSGYIILISYIITYLSFVFLFWSSIKYVGLVIAFVISFIPGLILSGIGNTIYKKIAKPRVKIKYYNYYLYLSDLEKHNQYLKKWEEKKRLLEQERRQRELIERRKQKEYWLNLGGLEFEKQIADLFKSLGYKTKLTKSSGDEGIDIFLNGKQIAVQCKNHNKPVSQSVIRDLYGAMMHHGSSNAILISTNGFSDAVKSFAKGKPIQLWDVYTIINKAKEIGMNYA